MSLDAAHIDPKDLQTVVVTAQRLTLDTLPQKILDAPQSINLVTTELLQQQVGTSLADALKNVPGITLNAGEGGTHGDLVNIRGFSAGDDYFMDGLRDTGIYDRDAFDYESVEVYKGPASTLFGRGSTGGVINQVLKTPQLAPIFRCLRHRRYQLGGARHSRREPCLYRSCGGPYQCHGPEKPG